MSSWDLIQDTSKPWLNIRVNNATVDSTLTTNNLVVTGNFDVNNLDVSGTLSVDTIVQHTLNNGVNVDNVSLKNGNVTLPVGGILTSNYIHSSENLPLTISSNSSLNDYVDITGPSGISLRTTGGAPALLNYFEDVTTVPAVLLLFQGAIADLNVPCSYQKTNGQVTIKLGRIFRAGNGISAPIGCPNTPIYANIRPSADIGFPIAVQINTGASQIGYLKILTTGVINLYQSPTTVFTGTLNDIGTLDALSFTYLI